MTNSDWLHEKQDHPAIRDLILLRDCARALTENAAKEGSPKTLAAVAKQLNKSQWHLYRRLNDIAKRLGRKGGVFEVTRGKGAEIKDASLLNRLEHFLAAYRDLLEPESARQLTIEFGAPQILSARLLPKPFAEFNELTDYDVTIKLECDHPHLLVDRARFGRFDLVMTSCPEEFNDDSVVARLKIHNCVVCPTRHKLLDQCVGDRWQRRLPDWNILREYTIAMFSDHRVSPGLPWGELPDFERTIRVGSEIEAHGYVLSQSAIALTHRELLSQEEEKYFDVIDPPQTSRHATTSIVLLRPQKDVVDSKAEAVGSLVELLKSHLVEIETNYNESVELSKKFGAFQSAWYAREVVRNRRKSFGWVGADLDLYATASGYVRGHQKFSFGEDFHAEHAISKSSSEADYITFGRMKKRADGNEWHLIWRGTWDGAMADDHYDVQFLLREEDLSGECLVGVWFGRLSRFSLCSGPVVLLRNPRREVTVKQIRDGLKKFAKKHRWIREQPWELPDSLITK